MHSLSPIPSWLISHSARLFRSVHVGACQTALCLMKTSATLYHFLSFPSVLIEIPIFYNTMQCHLINWNISFMCLIVIYSEIWIVAIYMLINKVTHRALWLDHAIAYWAYCHFPFPRTWRWRAALSRLF